MNKNQAALAWAGIEAHINHILEHLKDGREVGNIHERASEIERHARGIKAFYDWIDNNCHLDFY
jgi:plasmid stabilization system protein ParE